VGPLHISRSERQPGGSRLGAEDEGRSDKITHRQPTFLWKVTLKAQRAADVLTMDHDVGEHGDRRGSRRRLTISRSPAQIVKDSYRILVASSPAIGGDPAVEIEAVCDQSGQGGSYAKGTLGARSHVRGDISDAPSVAERGDIPLRLVNAGEAIS
jgi:hypothetical protein